MSKITFIDPKGKRYPARLVGPKFTIVKPAVFTEDALGNRKITDPGETVYEAGIVEITVRDGEGQYIKKKVEYVDLEVNYGSQRVPHLCRITGVRKYADLENTTRKAFYEVSDEPDAVPAKGKGKKTK